MEWTKKFNSLRGQKLSLSGQPLQLVKYVLRGKEVDMLTTLDDYTMPVSQAADWLDDLTVSVRPARRTGEALAAVFSDGSALQKMQQALLRSLERVQDDPSFAPQALEVSRLVQTGINLAKVELDAFSLANKIIQL